MTHLGGGYGFLLRSQHGPSDDDVQQEITVQNDHIPEEDGAGSRVEEIIKGPGRLPQVHDDEGEAHEHGGYGQKFPQDGDLAEGLVVMEVVGQNQHDRRSCHSDQEGKLGDIERPGDIPAHAGDAQAVIQLAKVEKGSHPDEEDKKPTQAQYFRSPMSAFSSMLPHTM